MIPMWDLKTISHPAGPFYVLICKSDDFKAGSCEGR